MFLSLPESIRKSVAGNRASLCAGLMDWFSPHFIGARLTEILVPYRIASLFEALCNYISLSPF